MVQGPSEQPHREHIGHYVLCAPCQESRERADYNDLYSRSTSVIELTILLSLPATPFGSRTVSVGTTASVTTYHRGSEWVVRSAGTT
jgi:hypothetical protein